MKEFSAQTGGRYTYADDLENLQELALAFAELFDDCDNFIVSGCEVTGSAISAGYVFLNGKLRSFSGATGLTSWPQYIYELNTTESVPYESGGAKVGRNIYGCTIGKSVPVTADPLTGKVPTSLAITSTGGLRMKDAFIGKYALLLDPANGSQIVNSLVNFAKDIQTNGDLTANKSVAIKNGAVSTRISYSGSTFSISSTGNSNTYQISVVDGVGIRFYCNNALIATIGHSSITFNKPLSSSQGTFGGLVLTGNHLYQGTANGTADAYINYYSYNGGSTQFRNTHIGNGKGKSIISVTGSSNTVGIFGATTIASGVADGLVLKANALKTNNALTNAIAWTDSANATMARIGFISSEDNEFNINSASNNIRIMGATYVNIGPVIKENGVFLSERYAMITTMNTALDKKANTSDVYSTKQADAKFAKLAGGLSQFVSATVSKSDCRSHIGAVGTDDLSKYAKLDQFLADMAGSEASKKKIRDNIGAASAGDYEPKMADSGWKLIKDSLYVRQIGNIVCIQGSTKTIHSGTVFTIPNTIAAPSHAVKHTIGFANNRTWVCKIAAGQRACQVMYCDSSCNRSTEFSITYMV